MLASFDFSSSVDLFSVLWCSLPTLLLILSPRAPAATCASLPPFGSLFSRSFDLDRPVLFSGHVFLLPFVCSYSHLYALKDSLLGEAAAWVPSGGGASRYSTEHVQSFEDFPPPCFICKPFVGDGRLRWCIPHNKHDVNQHQRFVCGWKKMPRILWGFYRFCDS